MPRGALEVRTATRVESGRVESPHLPRARISDRIATLWSAADKVALAPAADKLSAVAATAAAASTSTFVRVT